MKMKDLFRRGFSLLLIAALALSMAACSNGNTTDPDPTDAPTETTNPTESTSHPANAETLPQVSVDNPATFISLNMTSDYLLAHNTDGLVTVDFSSSQRKRGQLDENAMAYLTSVLETSGLVALNGQKIYGEGDAYASLSVEYADGTTLSADYSGSIPEAFTTGYQAMEAAFIAASANLPVYVPTPMVMEGVNPDALAAMEGILLDSGMEGLDSLSIADIPVDDTFSFTSGLSSAEGISSGTICSSMINTVPYSLVIVTTEDGADPSAVAADFEASIDWRKWVCVGASNAMIARKDNMVLCLVGSDIMYTLTASAIENAGWTVVNTLSGSNM